MLASLQPQRGHEGVFAHCVANFGCVIHDICQRPRAPLPQPKLKVINGGSMHWASLGLCVGSHWFLGATQGGHNLRSHKTGEHLKGLISRT